MPSEEWQAVRNVAMLQLALGRATELAQEALQALACLERWRNTGRSDLELTECSMKLKGALEEQCRWLQAIAEQLEDGP